MEGLDDVLERGGDDLGLDFSDLSEGEERSSSSEPDSDEGEVEPPHMDGLSVTAPRLSGRSCTRRGTATR